MRENTDLKIGSNARQKAKIFRGNVRHLFIICKNKLLYPPPPSGEKFIYVKLLTEYENSFDTVSRYKR